MYSTDRPLTERHTAIWAQKALFEMFRAQDDFDLDVINGVGSPRSGPKVIKVASCTRVDEIRGCKIEPDGRSNWISL